MNIGRCLEILELQSAESLDEVKKAYKVLVKVWHPDRFNHDPDLRKKAEDKIQQINAAYEELRRFFTQKRYKIDQKSIGSDHFSPNDHQRAEADPPSQPHPESLSKQRPPDVPPGRRTPAVTAKSSALGKYVFFGFLIGLAVFTMLVLHFLSRMDHSIRNLPEMALEKIEEKLKDFDEPAPPAVPQEKEPGLDTVKQKRSQSNKEPTNPARAKTPCIIYLHSGDYIIAEAWWYSDDMVEYRVKHGVVGIEKKRVKEIQCE